MSLNRNDNKKINESDKQDYHRLIKRMLDPILMLEPISSISNPNRLFSNSNEHSDDEGLNCIEQIVNLPSLWEPGEIANEEEIEVVFVYLREQIRNARNELDSMMEESINKSSLSRKLDKKFIELFESLRQVIFSQFIINSEPPRIELDRMIKEKISSLVDESQLDIKLLLIQNHIDSLIEKLETMSSSMLSRACSEAALETMKIQQLILISEDLDNQTVELEKNCKEELIKAKKENDYTSLDLFLLSNPKIMDELVALIQSDYSLATGNSCNLVV